MARIYKRGNTYTFVVEAGKDKDGNRDRITKGGFKKKSDASAAAALIEADIVNGNHIKETIITFREHAQRWLDQYSLSVKKSSVRVRTHELSNLYKYFDSIMLKDITKKQYQDCLYDLSRDGFAENTISGIHGTARMVFKSAVALDLIKKDPTEFARPPRKRETLADIESSDAVPKYLEKEDLKKFLTLAHDAGLESDYMIFLLLAYTGIRAGELCALKWQDIDFETKTIRITRTYYNPKNNIKLFDLDTPKTISSRRTIEVDDTVIRELKLHEARQNKSKMKNRDIWYDEDFIFTVRKTPGYPIYVKLIENRMNRLLRLSELSTELTPHSLRHTHTSLLAEAGVGLEEIMERLGHIDDSTTRKVYLHVTKDMKKEAAHKFAQLMNRL